MAETVCGNHCQLMLCAYQGQLLQQKVVYHIFEKFEFMLESLYIKEDKKLKQHYKSRDCLTFNQVFMGLRK